MEQNSDCMTRRSDDMAAIRKLAMDWSAGWDSGNVDALLSLFAEEPVLMPLDLPIVIGKSAIRSLYRSLFKEYVIRGKGKVVEADASGNLRYIWNSYSLTTTPKTNGVPTTSKGKSLFIVRRQSDSSWKIARLIDNSDGNT